MVTCFLIPTPFKSLKPNPNKLHHSNFTCLSVRAQSLLAKQDRGLKTQKIPNKRDEIIKAIDAMAVLGSDMVTTDDSLSATWRLLWTTEEEELFIIEEAYLFGTQSGGVLQVIDVEKRTLNNAITFHLMGRVNFRFESVYLDDEIRVVKDIRGDYLVVDCAPYTWKA